MFSLNKAHKVKCYTQAHWEMSKCYWENRDDLTITQECYDKVDEQTQQCLRVQFGDPSKCLHSGTAKAKSQKMKVGPELYK